MAKKKKLIDIEELKKLPPDERIKIIRELQEKLKKKIEDEETEISETELELEDAKEELAVLEEIMSKAPSQKPIDIEKLFKEEIKEEKDLEEIAEESAPEKKEMTPDERKVYIDSLAQVPINYLRESVDKIGDEIKKTGVITAEQQYHLDTLREAVHAKTDVYSEKKEDTAMLSEAEKAIFYATHPEEKYKQ